MVAAAQQRAEPWRARLFVPNYPMGEAAKYAGMSAAAVRSWHAPAGNKAPTLPARESRSELSYLQLIEIAVVASFRKSGISLPMIRQARAFAAEKFKTDHPFAEYRFKTDGRTLMADLDQLVGDDGKDKLVNVNKKGQLEWDAILGARLREFEYEDDLAIRWHVAGENSPVFIDPRISFGAPVIRGKPTWLFRDRWVAQEPIATTARDFGVKVSDVEAALKFEGIDISAPPESWLN
ncbi:hypothetical protein [Phenylobacterium sp.]|jgi:uncharacterized protein (DUF433 family)|uniref:hypothetical protein n=1 Tax=Phenylobacterium sp. TaxID=1871053 RepID=UPI002E3252FC|nr:hypothetical protein [Phenylobacterium sp.]HEX3367624.1 hypothetical protein [Phenylobacterium sp.]